MFGFFEIDFIDVETQKSGDAICIRYSYNNLQYIHIVDGGYQETGEKLSKFIDDQYGFPDTIDHVVVTHNDGDHTGGLRKILEERNVSQLWMLRPWLYAGELLPRFTTYTSVERLTSRLRSVYSNLAALEEIADRRGIPIYEPFQGQGIGAFRVMAPTRNRYLELIVNSERTPEATASQSILQRGFRSLAEKTKELAAAAWGEEYFPPEPTSNENEMSVVQYANFNGTKVLLTGDTGRQGLREIIDFAPRVGLALPGIDRFQVPHHGGRHNVSTDLLDAILGPRLPVMPPIGEGHFNVFISSAKADASHPRRAVVRAMLHRGANVSTTENGNIYWYQNIPRRQGWGPAPLEGYPTEQEQ